MKRVYLDFLGCRLNEAELQQWATQLRKRQITLVPSPGQADAIVLNTCAVTGEASRKSRQRLRRLHRENPQARLVVSGCYATLSPDELAHQLGVDLVVPNPEKDLLVDKLCDLLDWPVMPEAAAEPDAAAIFSCHRDRAFVKIQDGCRYRCTYCVVTLARGEERSRPIAELVAEVQSLYAQGIYEIVLTGVHVGGYGSDIGENLSSLVGALLSDTDIPRIRFASVEPWDLPDNFWSLFENPRLMPHMHLPMQSGSDSVLRRMSRRCRRAEFIELVKTARRHVPNFNVTTDIIVGFPGETEQDFEASVSLVEEVGFGHVHIFSFSPRSGTKAARLPNQVDNQVKKARSQRLHQIAARTARTEMARQIGNSVEILFESEVEAGSRKAYRYWGHTPNYFRVGIESDRDDLGGAIGRVSLSDISSAGRYIEGTLVEVVRAAPVRQSIPLAVKY
ncbi:MAG: tRNA (N(6)-L-threonylcarbamoyladenosine(37)-C(2))-methylthiotransferase MtaB [Gammaproteobacteria bacterium]|nr:MAG: tRNA (N(6)-L-threonylcarbamoyladenosine(37)-C(2))-methylthiotransferase MtaB [Gammaproteobacteria bacterium]